MDCMGIVLPAGTFPRNCYSVVVAAAVAANVLDVDSPYAVVIAACSRYQWTDLMSHQLNPLRWALTFGLMMRSHLVGLFDRLVAVYYSKNRMNKNIF